MGTIVSDHAYRGSRTGGRYADATMQRKVEVWQGGVVTVLDTENRVLHQERLADMPRHNITDDFDNGNHLGTMGDLSRFIALTCHATVSNQSGRVLVYLFGFTADTGDARDLTVALDYFAKPEVPFPG